MMLLILLIGILFRWTQQEIFWWNRIVFSTEEKFITRIAPQDRSRCNGSTLVQRKPPGNWRVICGRHIQFCSRMTQKRIKVTSRMMLNLRGGGCNTPRTRNSTLFERLCVKYFFLLLWTKSGQTDFVKEHFYIFHK